MELDKNFKMPFYKPINSLQTNEITPIPTAEEEEN